MDEVTLFKALADQTRLKILDCIRRGEKCICEIIPYTGKSQPNVSQHLKILKHAGLISERKEGKKIFVYPYANSIYNIINQAKAFK